MKNSNKVLLTIIVCFLLCTVFVAVIVRGNLVSSKVISGEIVSSEKGENVTRFFNVGDFSELDMSGFGHVLVKAGEQSNISISTDDGYFSNITVGLTGNKLSINTEHGIKLGHDRKVDIVIVTNQSLKKIIINGASHLDYADINSNNMVLEANGASHCDLSGKISSLQIEINGASDVNARNLIANDVNLKTSGAANIEVYAKSFLEIHAYGVANINYYGNPKNVVRDVYGMASIKSMD
jgi:hypothetical protein